MKAATLTFIRQRFTEYYGRVQITPPSSSGQREFGFIFFEGNYPDDIRMRRHIGFGSPEEMQVYIKNLVPAHAYYSTAYYRTPQAATMADKEWLGADLIFDLDADHILRGSYHLMLERIKEEAIKLVNVLDEELGIDMRTVRLVFSGGRGYHLHVQEIALRSFDAQERRELIDYICGIGISPGRMMSDFLPGRLGWHQRYRSCLISYLQQMTALPISEAKASLCSLRGIGDTRATRFMQQAPALLQQLETDPRMINTRDPTTIEILSILATEKESPLYAQVREAGIQADEPVTTDIRRLIRLPGSLHAKSGFRVTPLTVKELPDFDPLIDAVPFGDRSVVIDAPREYSVQMLGNTFPIIPGVQQVPEAVALFLCCRGMAEIAGGGSSAS
ncbi:MAG: DNA primase catalytic subunit PriS [Methanospirillum sp.]|uniref:DNA primase catalytic subunit PriS n=1 Tax=Methanospirillum sp. TaxID=45200 RepID=UPI00236D40B9|nr:DNA primase catalytic subunit PriS [Methanospirillum sp.]MDD1728014.1 DNA primase catalytic subunit PriS [Methanospirillum sp.]